MVLDAIQEDKVRAGWCRCMSSTLMMRTRQEAMSGMQASSRMYQASSEKHPIWIPLRQTEFELQVMREVGRDILGGTGDIFNGTVESLTTLRSRCT